LCSEERLKKNQIFLSVVIIGRNEGDNLPKLFTSLPVMNGLELIYVDSGSTDDSAAMAYNRGARVFQIKDSDITGPAAGRYVGTLEARGIWALYLDGDMVLSEAFHKFIGRVMSDFTTELGTNIAGFVGRTRNIYLDHQGMAKSERDYAVLPAKEMGPLEKWGYCASYHGGAVLYRREAVLLAGNWNPAVYQLEEIDLYCRIKSLGYHVRAIDIPMVDHYTPYLSLSSRFMLNFSGSWKGKKLIGAGQVVKAHWQKRTLFSFIRCYPYPFIVLTGIITTPLLFTTHWPLFLGTNMVIAIYIGVKTRWYYYLVYLGNLLQIFRGLGKYRDFTPGYQSYSE